MNVLDNAAKWSPTGGTVGVKLEATDAWHLTVTDQGPGVAPGDLPHIFERFTAPVGPVDAGFGPRPGHSEAGRHRPWRHGRVASPPPAGGPGWTSSCPSSPSRRPEQAPVAPALSPRSGRPVTQAQLRQV